MWCRGVLWSHKSVLWSRRGVLRSRRGVLWSRRGVHAHVEVFCGHGSGGQISTSLATSRC